VNRIEGITRAAIAPAASSPDPDGSQSHVFSGLGAIVQLGDANPRITRRAAMMVVYLGEDGAAVAGGSRAAALLELRSALDDALDYAGHKSDFQSGNRRSYALSMIDLEALQSVIEGGTPLLAHVDRASDIRTLLALASEYGLRLIVSGGAEAWMLADEIAASGTGVIVSATSNLPGNFDQLNVRLDAAALLAQAGVQVALGGDRNGQNHNARNVTQVAGIAVANGMTWENALRAITSVPAKLYGVDDRVGSIEQGKDADLVIWSSDPLELTSYPDAVYVMGRSMPMQSRQTLLRDRYRDTDSSRPPAFRR
jgi:imidazolonepropionase-like amidohydrolase